MFYYQNSNTQMLDTVTFKLTQSDVEGCDFLNEVTPYLDPDEVTEHNKGGNVYVTGRLGNLSVSINPWRVTVGNGSLCKWMFGDNYQAMGRGDIQHAIEKLSDTLHLPIERANVMRIDVGLSIPVREPVENYLNHLGALNYATRLLQPSSLYYKQRQGAKILCFYDKNREQRDKGGTVPELYKDANVLRYELRYMKRVPHQFGVETVTGAALYEEAFYISLLNRWREAYQAIRKINNTTLNFQDMKTKRDLQRMGILALVERWGGEVETINRINEAQKRGDLTSKQAFDLRQGIKDACEIRGGLTAPSEAISELNKKVADAVKFYR